MKFLTTQAERRFVRMQADKNVLVLREGEKSLLEMDPGDLSQTERNALIGDSSAFSSDDYDAYVDQLDDQVKKKHKVITDREQKLMSGVFLKEQEMKHLTRLGLGGLLRELKLEKQRKMGLYASTNASQTLRATPNNKVAAFMEEDQIMNMVDIGRVKPEVFTARKGDESTEHLNAK